MSFLRRQLDKIAPLFEEGGRLHKLYPLYEAADSFLYTPGRRTSEGPHIRDGIDLKRTMMTVVWALLPCALFGMWNAGRQAGLAAGQDPGAAEAFLAGLLMFLPRYLVVMAVGGGIETVFAAVRKHEINEGFLVTGLLIPLIVPPTIPLWQLALGTAFGVVIGKEVFGGTGMNVLNPALTTRVFLFFAYPAQISGDLVWVAGREHWLDGFSGATPLAHFYADGAAATAGMSWSDAFLGLMPGSFGETSTLCCLIGAAILLFTRIASWRVMLGCLLGMAGTASLFNLLAPSPEHYLALPWYWHLVVGGFAFGTVFMATDPVSAAQTDTGRWIYGVLIGVLTVLVRVVNPAYPEGMMLAILFMNIFAPVIDYYVVKANVKRREQRLGVQ
ncbi:MAG: NADH:ubiquinone reductase (Na(+)-transporting) subunit B [Planctomycetota bacterium]|nr:MAG: NADH:ubiquinone reductase (Na(+)-transporting) subunit B [Planctomycetota bacterium]